MPRPNRLWSAVLYLTVLGTACGPPAPSADTPAPSRTERRSNALITREELQKNTARDAFSAIRSLRPDWFRGRGPTSLQGGVPEVVVYLDGQRVGTRDVLAQFQTAHIKEMRYFGATEATQKWGTDHSGGVIEVITR